MSQQMAQMNPAANVNPFGPGQDPDKTFLAEAENLEVMEHYSIMGSRYDYRIIEPCKKKRCGTKLQQIRCQPLPTFNQLG